MTMKAPKTPKPDIIAEASAWFIEFRTGEVAGSERARFDEWLRRSPEHIHAYLEIAAGWAELPTSDPDRRIDIPSIIQRARQSHDDCVVTLSRRPPLRPVQRRLSVRAWATSLAGLSLAIALAIGVYLSEANTYRTGVSEQRTVELSDGSTIELNSLSKVRVRLSRRLREIDLARGQALFHVAKDPERPFIVRSDDMTVRAVGTQFDVYRKTSGTTVTVVEGRVAVSASDTPSRQEPAVTAAPSFLAAGDQVTVPTDLSQGQDLKPKHADVAAATAWVHRRLIFEETPLSEVAEEFNRYNTRRLVIVDLELRSLGISGVYSSNDPDSLLGFLRAQPNIQLVENNGEIRVTLRGKK
jgi:transmembrane sensor